MNCDRIARWYRWFEYAAFGNTLQRRRCEFLGSLGNPQAALVIGDGDGRFLVELHRNYPGTAVDSIDLSARMIQLARRRVASPRVNFIHGDARSVAFPRSGYDLIATHFFLDCLSNSEAVDFIARVSSVAAPNARWIVSEFRMPRRGWRAWHAALWLSTMYLFFRLTTGLSARRLPCYRESMTSHGFILGRDVTERFGLVASEYWTRAGT